MNAPAKDPGTESVEMSYSEAIKDALDIALRTDERVILMGEDIGVYGGAFQVTGDLVHTYGEDRVMDTPISELGGAGVAVGAALVDALGVIFNTHGTMGMQTTRVRIGEHFRHHIGMFFCQPCAVQFGGHQFFKFFLNNLI